jgi:Zn-dependent protease with chaperone function
LPFLVLLVLTLVCLQGQWPEPPGWLGPGGSALVTGLGLLGLAGAAARSGRRLCTRLHADPAAREGLLAACGRHRRRLVLGLIGYYVLALYLLGWGWTARSLLATPAWAGPGAEVLILAPFLAGLFLLWFVGYDLDRAVRATSPRPAQDPFPSRGAFVALQARHNLLLALPPLILLVLQQVVLSLLPEDVRRQDWLLPALAACLLVAVFVGIPWFLRLFLGLRPLPEGPLRDRLLGAARRLRFRCNDILLWDTHNTAANAMVTGPLPLVRYVVLTDRLVRDMTPEEIEAVFGHEVGHIKHQHMLFYFGFLLASLVVLAALWNTFVALLGTGPLRAVLGDWLPAWDAWREVYETLALLPLVTLLGAYIFLVFGYVSRRCERQADICGCRAVSTPIFIEALEKVARLNGISRDRPGWLSSWQHSTIARRVEFLQRLHAEPTLGRRFQRRVGLLKWGMVCSLGLFLLGAWAVHERWAVRDPAHRHGESFWTFLGGNESSAP